MGMSVKLEMWGWAISTTRQLVDLFFRKHNQNWSTKVKETEKASNSQS